MNTIFLFTATEHKNLLINFKIKQYRYVIHSFIAILQAYHLGMYGYKYVWILPSDYPWHWWKYSSDNCTLDQIAQALDGHFIADIMDEHQPTQHQGQEQNVG